ncbi:MAG TPA: CopG family transcriptional regulator [Candidatus Limnocylindrales bacterium]
MHKFDASPVLYARDVRVGHILDESAAPDVRNVHGPHSRPEFVRQSHTLTHHHESSSLMGMTKRLQVLLNDDELRQIQRLARGRRMTTAAWVRESLQASVEAETRVDLAGKLAAIRRAVGHELPTGDIDQLLAEIESGYLAPNEG